MADLVKLAAFASVVGVFPIGELAVGSHLGNWLPETLGVPALAVPYVWSKLGLDPLRWAPWVVFASALGISCFSVVSGFYNGLTDEPYAMPAFLAWTVHGHDPYAQAVTVSYSQYGTAHTIHPAYNYLPALLFLQPYVVSYKWFAVATWAVSIYLLRARPVAVVTFGQMYVGLLAASGFNDLPVLCLLTLGFVGWNGRRQRWARLLALGCKQFANVFEIVYYAALRDLRQVAVAVGVTFAFLLPFLVWDPNALLCGVVPVRIAACTGPPAASTLTHLNYWAWPIWGAGVYYPTFAARLASRRRSVGSAGGAPAGTSSVDARSPDAGDRS